jgi:hypothetical protein
MKSKVKRRKKENLFVLFFQCQAIYITFVGFSICPAFFASVDVNFVNNWN